MEKRRYLDISSLAREDRDFIHRRSGRGTLTIVFFLVAAFAALTAAALKVEDLGYPVLSLIAGCLLMLIVVLLMLLLERVNERAFASEFENLLFSGVAATGAAFFFVVKNGRHVVYYHPSCSRFFSHQPYTEGREYQKLIDGVGLSGIDWRAVHEDTASSVHVPVTLKDVAGRTHTLVLTVEPVARPKGYAVVRAEASGTPTDGPAPGAAASDWMLDQMPWAIYKLDDAGIFTYANHAFASLLGYFPGELTSRNTAFSSLVFGSEALLGDSLHQDWEGTLALKSKPGKPVKVSLRQIAQRGRRGVTRYGFVTRADQVAAQVPSASASFPEALAQVWNYFLEHSPIAVALMDADGMVAESNAAFRRFMGKTERSGWKLLDGVQEKSRRDVSALLGGARTEAQAEAAAVEVTLTSGTIVSLSVSAVRGVADRRYALAAHMIDTTEQKNLELRFVHSQKMQAVGQLAGGIAHDFNNLLTAMIGFCDLLLTRHPPGEQSFADIMQIKQNANRAANLVRQLLAFSRRQTLQPETVNVTDMLVEISHLVRRLIGENIELKIQHGRDLWPVLVDHGQFEQVVINLAVNARDAMSGGGQLTIHTRNVTVGKDIAIAPEMISSSQEEIAPGDYVLIEMIDTGCGMSREVMQQIFEPFFTTKGIGQGTGLGLSTVSGIIQQTGGHLYVSSAVGKGTRFSIFLKRHNDEGKKDAAAAPAPAAEQRSVPQDLTGAGTVLLVEDEDPVRLFSVRALRNKGYTVFEADSGEAALKVIEERGGKIDVIVTDVVMPGITGPTMVEQVTQRHPRIKVIFISGYGEDVFMKSFGKERKFNFLPKPYSLNDLAGKVKEVMLGTET